MRRSASVARDGTRCSRHEHQGLSTRIWRRTAGSHAFLKLPAYLQIISTPLIRKLEVTLEQKFRWSRDEIDIAFASILAHSLSVDPIQSVQICRDPDDDRVLECALAGQADVIVTGDRDLLALHPFQGTPILTVRQFLDRVRPSSSSI